MAVQNPEKNAGYEADSNQAKQPISDLALPKKPKRNKYALACSVLASMTSILLGYGNNNTLCCKYRSL